MFPSKRSDAIPNSAVEFVERSLQPQGLSNIQKIILEMCWAGTTYQSIADSTGYDDSYIRAVGARLWHRLSKVLGRKVSKNNFKAVLERQQCHQRDIAMPSKSAAMTLASPTGPVPLGSLLYIEREPIESECYETITQPGALIRIKSPRQTGKTSLMARIIDSGRKRRYATVTVNFELASTDILSNVDKFFRWFCLMVSKALELPCQLENYWETLCGSGYNCTEYFEGYLLATLEKPLVLALDNADIIFHYPEIATDFFGMLRAWYESGRYGDADSAIWQRLRLVAVYSTDVYIPLPIHQSPFNVGMFVELAGFTAEQVATLAKHHQLDWTDQDVKFLMSLVSGHPYLVRLTLYHAKQSSLSLVQIWGDAIAPNSIYTTHLQNKFWTLQPHADLLESLKQVVTATEPQELEPVASLKLEGMGLITIRNGRASLTCELYNRYFNSLFALTSR